MKKCRMCRQKKVLGRSDKIFCSVSCKSKYHRKLRKQTKIVSLEIDEILHRNRSILQEILGKNGKRKKVKRLVLEKKKFRYKYHTHFFVNTSNKTYFQIYDLAWMEFSDDEILIVRQPKSKK